MYKLRTKITLFAEIGNHAAIIISLCDALARHKKRVPDTLAGHSVVSRRIRYFTSSNSTSSGWVLLSEPDALDEAPLCAPALPAAP